MLTTAFLPIDEPFTAAEQQSISVETPGLFDKSQEFSVDFGALGEKDYSFPLPVGKAELANKFGQQNEVGIFRIRPRERAR